MNDLEPFWRALRACKPDLPGRASTNALRMGLEVGLDELINITSSDDPDVLAIQAEKAIARGKARDRHRRHLRLRYLDPHEVDDPIVRLDDRARLRETWERASEDRATDFAGLSLGKDSATLAREVSILPAAMRKRIDRLRAKLAA